MASGPSGIRQRKLAVLGGATLAVIALAGLALTQRAAEMGRAFEPEPLFPGLAARVNEMAEIAVETKDGAIHIRLAEDGNGAGAWVIAEKNGFPADVGAVRATGAGMATLEAFEPRTAQAELFDRLGLGAPADGGDAVRIVLSDRGGEVMADLLIGNTQDIADPEGRNRIYVRRNGENQTWLARGSLVPRANIAEWLDGTVLDLTRDRIQSAVFTPRTGPRFTLTREDANTPDFELVDMPPERALNYPGAANNAATALVGFTFDDVLPAAEIDFSDAVEVVTTTFDGLTLTARMAAANSDAEEAHWVSIAASADNAEREAEQDAIAANVDGWAFKLPQFSADDLLTTRDSLLRPLGD